VRSPAVSLTLQRCQHPDSAAASMPMLVVLGVVSPCCSPKAWGEVCLLPTSAYRSIP
jgi:hypothetical protein